MKIKDGEYLINLDEYKSIGPHWIALYLNGNNATYFDSFIVKHIPKEIKTLIGNKNIISNFYRTQAYKSIMCEYFSVDYTLQGKSLLDYTNLLSLNKYE